MVSRLDIEVVAPDENGHELVATRLLVDGQDVISDAFDAGPGEDPDRLLGSQGRLRPDTEPHEARLAEALCTEGCCGAIYVRIWRDGDTIVWDGWRDPCNPALALDTFRFDAAAYLHEIERADRDRGWEWPGRTVARLLRERLRAQPDLLGRWDSELDFVECLPWERREVRVAFYSPPLDARRSTGGAWSQYMVRLPVSDAAPDEQATAAFDRLSADDPRRWAERVGGTR